MWSTIKIKLFVKLENINFNCNLDVLLRFKVL